MIPVRSVIALHCESLPLFGMLLDAVVSFYRTYTELMRCFSVRCGVEVLCGVGPSNVLSLMRWYGAVCYLVLRCGLFPDASECRGNYAGSM